MLIHFSFLFFLELAAEDASFSPATLQLGAVTVWLLDVYTVSKQHWFVYCKLNCTEPLTSCQDAVDSSKDPLEVTYKYWFKILHRKI